MEGKEYHVSTSHKSKTATLLLCIFTGMLGGHMFYVGRIGMGVLYLFTGGLFCIGWWLDIVRVASGTFKDGAGVAIRK